VLAPNDNAGTLVVVEVVVEAPGKLNLPKLVGLSVALLVVDALLDNPLDPKAKGVAVVEVGKPPNNGLFTFVVVEVVEVGPKIGG